MNADILEGCLRAAVTTLDPVLVRSLVHSGAEPNIKNENGESLLHLLAKTELSNGNNSKDKLQQEIVYILTDAGVDVNELDDEGRTALENSVNNNNLVLCDVLLQCGADMYVETETGISLINVASMKKNESNLAKQIHDTFQKYQPGLWNAVYFSNIGDVRMLINLWCKVDIAVDGKTLSQLALETGQEEIIGLILGIRPTMRLVYHVLAGNYLAAKNIVEQDKNKLQMDLRNMSNNGAPILYYAIQRRDAAIIKLLVANGSKVYTNMRDSDRNEMPVLFTAISPNVPAILFDALLPREFQYQEELLYKLLYKGKHALETAIESQAGTELLSILLERGGPRLLASRNRENQTVRDTACRMRLHNYVMVIDQIVLKWVTNPNLYPERRKDLAAWGYDRFPTLDEDTLDDKNSGQAKIFYEELEEYQRQISRLSTAVDAGNLTSFERFCEWKDKSENNFFERNLAWYSRKQREGLPMLHRAVLNDHTHLVKFILVFKPINESIDNLLDQHHRTALHYAYGMPNSDEIKNMLLQHGASEHTLDKNGYEPLDFKIKQRTAEMEELISRVRDKNDNTPEPNPWQNGRWKTEDSDIGLEVKRHYCINHNLEQNISHMNHQQGGYYEDEEDQNCTIL